VRFLIDECLSVDLVTVAEESGNEAQHVAHVGRAGWKDWNVVRYALEVDLDGNGGLLEYAQQIAAHESARTTKLYDRRNDQVTLDQVERFRY
jgi:hypothetical protein